MPTASLKSATSGILPYLLIARIDHWIKNVFVLPGLVVALSLQPARLRTLGVAHVLIGLLAVCVISSSNYVLNEILDAPLDRTHPLKRHRPVARGDVNIALAYVEWVVLLLAGLAISFLVSPPFLLANLGLWLAGCAYNIRPVRTKDIPYLDVASEAVNNPLRMLAGWYLAGVEALPITSLLISYWAVGGYFMAVKRFAEIRELDPLELSRYRPVFRSYSESRLLVSILFYACLAMLFLGAFIARYRLELALSFPLVALVMCVYLALAFQ